MFKELILGFRAYMEAHQLIKKHKLWGYVLLPGMINFILFISTMVIGWHYSAHITNEISEWMNLNNGDQEGWGIFKSIVKGFFWVLIRLFLIAFYLYVYKYVILIIMAPVIAILSEKTEELLTGNSYPFNFKQFTQDVLRGILIALKNLAIEFIILLLLILFTNIPVIGWISPLLIFLVESYFFGFSMMDYCNERRKLTIKESASFIYQHKATAIVNGGVFSMLLLVPVIGLLIAPSYGVIAATISTIKLREGQLTNRQ